MILLEGYLDFVISFALNKIAPLNFCEHIILTFIKFYFLDRNISIYNCIDNCIDTFPKAGA